MFFGVFLVIAFLAISVWYSIREKRKELRTQMGIQHSSVERAILELRDGRLGIEEFLRQMEEVQESIRKLLRENEFLVWPVESLSSYICELIEVVQCPALLPEALDRALIELPKEGVTFTRMFEKTTNHQKRFFGNLAGRRIIGEGVENHRCQKCGCSYPKVFLSGFEDLVQLFCSTCERIQFISIYKPEWIKYCKSRDAGEQVLGILPRCLCGREFLVTTWDEGCPECGGATTNRPGSRYYWHDKYSVNE